MKESVATKGIIGAFAGVISYLNNCIDELWAILGILILFDYILGIPASIKSGEYFDKNKAIWGALKKALYTFPVILGFLGDYIITYLSVNLGFSFSTQGAIGIAVTLYLIGTEVLSNIKNLIILGIPVPDFLSQAFGLIKDFAGRLIPKETKREEATTDGQNYLH